VSKSWRMKVKRGFEEFEEQLGHQGPFKLVVDVTIRCLRSMKRAELSKQTRKVCLEYGGSQGPGEVGRRRESELKAINNELARELSTAPANCQRRIYCIIEQSV
jgi:hypothetical protein